MWAILLLKQKVLVIVRDSKFNKVEHFQSEACDMQEKSYVLECFTAQFFLNSTRKEKQIQGLFGGKPSSHAFLFFAFTLAMISKLDHELECIYRYFRNA